MNHHARLRNHGFVTFVAMTMLVIVLAAMLLIGQTFAIDARRTLARQLDAQLDQMLLAGTIDASTKLGASTAAPANAWKVELPDSFSAISSLEIKPIQGNSPDGVSMTILAIHADRKASQDVHFQKIGGVWKLTAAELNEHSAVTGKR